jgi:hypothetical protein
MSPLRSSVLPIYTSFLQPFTRGAVSPSRASESDSPSGRISHLSYPRGWASRHYTHQDVHHGQPDLLTRHSDAARLRVLLRLHSGRLGHPPSRIHNPSRLRPTVPQRVTTHVHLDGFSDRASHKSLPNRSESSAPESARPTSFASEQSLNSIFRGYTNPYALHSQDGRYQRLICIEGVSRAVFGLGFGPEKGLLGEDALRTTVDLGKLQTSLGAAEKLQELLNAPKSRTKEENTDSEEHLESDGYATRE